MQACRSTLQKFNDSVFIPLVFMSPESAVSPPWRGIFESPVFKKNLAVLAVDEAHCISEWYVCLFTYTSCAMTYCCLLLIALYRGCDFRKSFSRLGGLCALTSAPVMALTASAPPNIKEAILSSLCLSEPTVIQQALDRPNIYTSSCKSVGLKVKLIISVLMYIYHK